MQTIGKTNPIYRSLAKEANRGEIVFAQAVEIEDGLLVGRMYIEDEILYAECLSGERIDATELQMHELVYIQNGERAELVDYSDWN